jgi:hypothetical protein
MEKNMTDEIEEGPETADNTLERMALGVFKAGSGVPPAAQTVIALRAFGLTPPQIAKRLGYKDSGGVRKLLYRYDPNRVAERGDAVRRLVLSCMFERVVMEALTGCAPAEIRALDVEKKIKVATAAAKAIKTLHASPIEISKNEADLIAELKGELDIEVEATEVV